MADEGATQDAARGGIRRRVRNWLDRGWPGKLARIAKELARALANRGSRFHFFAYVDGRPVGRAEAMTYYVATLHELATLDTEARARLPAEACDAFSRSIEEYREGRGLNTSAAWRRVLACTPEQKAELAVYAYARFRSITNCPSYGSFDWRGVYAANVMFTTLLRATLPFSLAQLETLVSRMAEERQRYNHTGDAPERAILRALERKKLAEDLNPEIEKHVRSIIAQQKALGEQYPGRETSKDLIDFRQRLEALLSDRDAPFRLPQSPWSALVENEIAHAPAEQRTRLHAILAQASTGRGARPTRAWLKQAEAVRHGSDNARVAGMLCAWTEKLWPARPAGADALPGAGPASPDPQAISAATIALHEELGRRLLWMAALLGCDAALLRAEKFSGSRVLFSGAVTALAMLDRKGVAALLNLRRKVKGAERAMVDKAIAAVAERQGVAVSTLEETTVPDYGLDASGTVALPAGAGLARISLAGSSATVTWVDASGTPRRSAPKAANAAEKQQIVAAKARARAISDTLKGQAARLEELYLADHAWPAEAWRKTYVDHPILAHFARGLVWSFTSRGERQLGILQGDRLAGVDGRTLDVAVDAEVRLWHPYLTVTEVVHAWRRRINALEITQPFKQAWREIYVLTDAERQTDTYSNRFASHVLQQSQFRAVGRARGWKIPAQGTWDGSGEYPTRLIPGTDRAAEFAVTLAADPGRLPDYALPYIVTDRLQFVSARGGPVPLTEIPPLILSEIFRDLDLFTSVASIGRDPGWADGGREGPFADYWRRTASDELYGSASTRREVLAEILPMLAIADKCRLDDRHLIVRGRLQTYRIHLGSGNIMMGLTNQYLCIVPAQTSETGPVRLPFEGDGLLSVILSKAFMLAEDDKITDPTIISQMRRWL